MSDTDRELPDTPQGAAGVGAVPGLLRLGTTVAWKTAGWTVGTSIRGTRRVLQAAGSGESAADLARDVQDVARRYARELIDFADLEERVKTSSVASTGVAKAVASVIPQPSASAQVTLSSKAPSRRPAGAAAARVNGSLHDKGELLIHRSRDVRYEVDAHPAYERILDEIAPDEGRILLLLLTKGPQAAVDVRTGGPLGLISSKLIAPGLSMIGARAGLRYVDRVPAYLNNLFRLGMIRFLREALHDPMPYQVLEAQPDVLEARHSVRQAKIVRRSIHLTPFGEGFCRACLPVGPETLGELPEHSTPKKPTKVSQPPAV
jgi:hypothetical protein